MPNVWSESLAGPERWRSIANYLTRMRFCSEDGVLSLKDKGKMPKNDSFKPWFEHKESQIRQEKIIFGHWSALEGKFCGENLFALDTGYVWGGTMRIMCLETTEYLELTHIESLS
jgi:bis(5'-nucleosyl)-tetraphosphatase (symmetrical)